MSGVFGLEAGRRRVAGEMVRSAWPAVAGFALLVA
jgi:hypothetical protein